MARKDRYQREIDKKADIGIGSGEVITEAISVAGTAVLLPSTIDTLAIDSQAILRSASTPLVIVNVTWSHPDGEIPHSYIIDYAEDVNFTVNDTREVAYGTTAAIYLKPDTTYWIRIAARTASIISNWSNVLTFTTIEDTVVPEDVDNVAAVYSNSNLIITWDQPSEETYKNARIRIWNPAGTILYNTYYERESPFIFTAAENRRIATLAAASPLTSVLVDVTSNSWGNVLGANPQTVSATAPLPTTPSSIVQSWNSDSGRADEDLLIRWAASTNAFDYVLTLDSRSIVVKNPFVLYPYFDNVQDHTPVLASGDYNLSYTIVARDLLDQQSVAASGTALNNPPPNIFGSVQITPGFTSLGIIITPSGDILDFSHYEFTVTKGVTTVAFFNSPDPIQTVSLSSAGTYDVSVRAVDKFNQRSNPIAVNGTYIDSLTIDELRAETTYTDSVNTANLAGLKDGDLTTTVVTYASGSSFKWTQAARPQLDRYKIITLGISATNLSIYFALSSDGTTWRWFSGPLAVTGTTGQNTTLVEYASESLADSNSFTKSTGSYRFDLPAIIEARFVRIYHKAAGAYSFREYYPRRIVQSDDLEAETIRGINISAAAISAGHISVTTLGAIQTSTGTLIINTAGYLRSGQTAYNTGTGFYLGNDSGTPKFSLGNSAGTFMTWNGTNLTIQGGGFTIQTAASAQRIVIDASGVVGYNSSGVLQTQMRSSDGAIIAGAGNVIINVDGISGYNSAVLQTQMRNSDGAIIAGAGVVVLNVDGITLDANTSITYNRPRATKWRDIANSEDVGSIRGWYNSTLHNIYIEAYTNNGGTKNGKIVLLANGTGPDATITLLGDSSEASITLDAGFTKISGGLNIGTATSAATGQIRMKNNANSGLFLDIDSGSSSAQNAGFNFMDRGTDKWYIYKTTGNDLLFAEAGVADRHIFKAGGNIGFNTQTQFGSGTGVIAIANRSVAPSTNPSGGGVLYVESGALKFRGSSGTVTTIANA